MTLLQIQGGGGAEGGCVQPSEVSEHQSFGCHTHTHTDTHTLGGRRGVLGGHREEGGGLQVFCVLSLWNLGSRPQWPFTGLLAFPCEALSSEKKVEDGLESFWGGRH